MIKTYTIIGSLVLLLILGVGFTAFSKENENALDEARIIQLEREIQSNIDEYQTIAPQKERNQSRCSLADTQGKQMTALNAANNAKRAELQFLKSKLRPQPAVK